MLNTDSSACGPRTVQLHNCNATTADSMASLPQERRRSTYLARPPSSLPVSLANTCVITGGVFRGLNYPSFRSLFQSCSLVNIPPRKQIAPPTSRSQLGMNARPVVKFVRVLCFSSTSGHGVRCPPRCTVMTKNVEG